MIRMILCGAFLAWSDSHCPRALRRFISLAMRGRQANSKERFNGYIHSAIAFESAGCYEQADAAYITAFYVLWMH